MSTSGTIIFYQTHRRADVPGLIRLLLRMGGCSEFYSVAVIEGPCTIWDRIRSGWHHPDYRLELIGDHLTADEVIPCYRAPHQLFLTLEERSAVAQVRSAVLDRIDVGTRGNYAPMELSVTIGYSDLIEEWPRARRIARPFLTLGFFGYGLPPDPTKCGEAILALPEVAAVRARFEADLGPLESCVTWSY